jgi:hypothetical protein
MHDPAPHEARAGTLWLRVQQRRAAWLTAGLLLAVYAATMSRDLGLFDSAELALVAHQLGLGHPIGQPLHTLLGFVFAHLPLLPPLVGLNLLSALSGALCVLPAFAIAERLSGGGARDAFGTALLAGALLVFGLHASLWEPATRVEVYATGSLLALWSVAFTWQVIDDGGVAARTLAGAGVGLGLAACASPYTALIAALALAPLVLSALVARRLGPRALLAAVAGGACALTLYAYVPLVAQRQGVLIWGAPDDARSLAHYFSGADFARNRSLTWSLFVEHVAAFCAWSLRQWQLPLLLLGIVGYLASAAGTAHALIPVLSAALTVALLASNAIFSPDVPDYLGYLLLPSWLCAAGAAALLARGGRRWLSTLLLAALAAASALAPPGWFERTRARDRFAREFATAALRAVPARAIVVAESDQFVAAALYLQHAERLRPDVVLLAAGLANSSWFWEQTFARHRDLRPIALTGPGGRDGRMRRLLDANPERTVLFERLELAQRTRIAACAGGYLLASGAACARRAEPDLAPSRLFDRTLVALGRGSPNTDGAVAAASFAVGDALVRLGHESAAMTTLLSGVPRSMRPALPPATAGAFAVAGSPVVIARPAWRRHVALGEPARNLFFAGQLALRSGRSLLAAELVARAAADGLPEALDVLERASPPGALAPGDARQRRDRRARGLPRHAEQRSERAGDARELERLRVARAR